MQRRVTSYDLARLSSLFFLRYTTIVLGIAARFLNMTKTPKTSGDDP